MHVLWQPLIAPRLRAGVPVGQLTLASLSAVAAGIHAWVVPEHYDEYAPFGLFFAVLGFAQAGWAVGVLRRPTRILQVAGIALSTGLLTLWALSRTAGLPIGPEPWEAEPAALLDVVASIAELGIIVLSAMSLVRAVENRTGPSGARGAGQRMTSPRPPAGGIRRTGG